MPEMHLRHLKINLRIVLVDHLWKTKNKKPKETGDSRYIYQNKLAFFQHDMAYGDFKDLIRRTFVIKPLILLKIQNMTDVNVDLLQWFLSFLIKNLVVVVLQIFLIKK